MTAPEGCLERYRDAEFSLEDLVRTSGRELRRLAVRPGDGRVASSPDDRTIRFYQTIGVIDRPVRYDGRRAMYGYRHLLQVVAVKRLQQEGRPLALIQRTLAGRSTANLEAALGLVPGSADPVGARSPRHLVAAELIPGVTITIDPTRVTRPQDLLEKIARLLEQTKEDGR